MKFITVGPLCWGQAKTAKASLRNCRENVPTHLDFRNPKTDIAFRTYLADDEAYVGDMGGLSYPTGKPPVLVGQFNIKGGELDINAEVKKKVA